MAKKIKFHTLGCKLNFSETSTLARQFEQEGYEKVTGTESGDIEVINTCSVTDHADKKCRNIIRKIIKSNPAAIVVVTGCYAQLKAAEIADIEGVDLVIGNNEKGNIAAMVRGIAGKGKSSIYTCDSEQLTSFFASFSSGDRTRTFLKVQDGCDYKCSYCTIPLARGASRNISISEIVSQAHEIAIKGIKEIVLTGVNIGDYGRTTGESLEDLITALDKVEGIERYRISSIEPNLLTKEILTLTTKSTKFQPHYHIPLQSGCDKILKLMRRRYTTEQFAQKISLVKQMNPDTFIGIDVIVGFPGESDEDFEATYNFLEGIAPAFLHIFPYSERDNTPAIEFEGKVSAQKKAERVKRLGELSGKLHAAFCAKYKETSARVLIEGPKKGGLMQGYTENYIKVHLPYNRQYIGKIVDVQLLTLDEEQVFSADHIL